MIQAPTSLMEPLSSSTGIKSAGVTRGRFAAEKRSNASAPKTVPSDSQINGW